MLEQNSDSAGCMRYCTFRRIGMTFSDSRRSNRLMLKPARRACWFRITGPSCWWSPTRIRCLQPFTMGIRHSGSRACVASSISTFSKVNGVSRGSMAQEQVQHTTSQYVSSARSAIARF